MKNSETLQIAKNIAREVHKGQKRKDGKDYITHPEAVAKRFKGTDEDCEIVAWLHDVLEDSNLTCKDLYKKGIRPFLVTSVDYITRKKDENYIHYILRVKEDEVATKVKIQDLKNNLWDLKNGSMRDKYLLALYILENVK